MDIHFREIEQFNCWIWLRFANLPSESEKNYLHGVFDSWYVIGRLGGFNADNLQAHTECGDMSWMSYDNENKANILPAVMHNLGELEYKNDWARCWIDMGTSDAVGIDILVNVLSQVSKDIVQIEDLFIGGKNEDWPIEIHPDSIFNSEEMNT